MNSYFFITLTFILFFLSSYISYYNFTKDLNGLLKLSEFFKHNHSYLKNYYNISSDSSLVLL